MWFNSKSGDDYAYVCQTASFTAYTINGDGKINSGEFHIAYPTTDLDQFLPQLQEVKVMYSGNTDEEFYSYILFQKTSEELSDKTQLAHFIVHASSPVNILISSDDSNPYGHEVTLRL